MWETHTLGAMKRCLGACAIPFSSAAACQGDTNCLSLVAPPKHADDLAKRARAAGRSVDDLGQLCIRITHEVDDEDNASAIPKHSHKPDYSTRIDGASTTSSESPSLPHELSVEEAEQEDSCAYADQARHLFTASSLSADESLHGDFACALRHPPVLIHGRLFVFERHVAFHASLFGATVTSKVWALDDIATVRKTSLTEALRLIYDGICITIKSTGKQYLLAAFSQRDDALACLRSAMARVHGGEDRGSHEGGTAAADAEDAASQTGELTSEAQAEEVGEYRTSKETAEVLSAPPVAACVMRKFDELGFQLHHAAPADPQDMELLDIGGAEKHIVHLPHCRPEAAFALFFAEGSRFTESFRTSHGDWDVHVGSWTEWAKALGPGRVRSLQFRSPTNIKFPGAPKETRVEETQRFRFFSSDAQDGDANSGPGIGGGGAKTVVLDSSTSMTDIPFGDRFSVETRLVISPSGCDAGRASSCSSDVRVLYKCDWKRSAPMVKSAVERQSKESTVQAYKLMCELMGHYLAGTDTRKLLATGMDNISALTSTHTQERRDDWPVPERGDVSAVPKKPPAGVGVAATTNAVQMRVAKPLMSANVIVLLLAALAMVVQGAVLFHLGKRAARRQGRN